MPRSDNTGVPETCPYINEVRDFLEGINEDDTGGDLRGGIKEACAKLEKIRQMNSDLRVFGNKHCDELYEMEKDRDYYKEQVDKLQNEVEYLTKEILELEKQGGVVVFFMAKKRFQTYFSVPVPPFKEEKSWGGSTPIRFVLTGRVPSKKNNQMSVAVRRIARGWAKKQQAKGKNPTWRDVNKAISMCSSKVRPNKEYQEWVERMKPVLHEQSAWWAKNLESKGLIFPIKKATMSLRLYFKDRYVTDTVNKQQAIQDLLISAGIIANDDYNSLNPIHSASACFSEEIIYDIAFITLSIKL